MSLPPGPSAPPLVQTMRFMREPLGFFRECYRLYGDVFTMKLAGMGPVVQVSSPALLKTLFTGSPEVLHAGEANEEVFGPLVGPHSVFVLEEQAHLRRRRLLLPPFHDGRMHEYAEVMRRETEKALAAWPMDRPFAAHPELQRITLQVILYCVLGVEGPSHAELEPLMFHLANEGAASPLLLMPALQWDLGRWSPWGKVTDLVRRTDAALLREIARRRAEGGRPERRDILSLLLQAKDEEGRGLGDRELRDELVTLVLAGHETTGTSLAWALECILTHPEVERKIREELAAVMGEGPLDSQKLSELEYLDAAIKESIRRRPIMSYGGTRVVKKPFQLGAYELPVGVRVANALSLVHYREDLYPDPEAFRPERFLGKRVDPYEWTPFGGGVRRCLGMAFALLEMKVVLATLIRSARLELARTPVRPVRRGFFIAPEEGLLVRLKERPGARVAA